MLGTRRFARRQQRWFRRDPRIRWIDYDSATAVDEARGLGDGQPRRSTRCRGSDSRSGPAVESAPQGCAIVPSALDCEAWARRASFFCSHVLAHVDAVSNVDSRSPRIIELGWRRNPRASGARWMPGARPGQSARAGRSPRTSAVPSSQGRKPRARRCAPARDRDGRNHRRGRSPPGCRSPRRRESPRSAWRWRTWAGARNHQRPPRAGQSRDTRG